MKSDEQLALRISDALSGRPVRWAKNVVGDYDGRDRTLEVFNADAREQRELLRRLRPLRSEMVVTAGGPVIVIFHTRDESARLYSDFIRSALADEVLPDMDTANRLIDVAAIALSVALWLDVPLRKRDVMPGTGSTELPRRAA
jgi:hypothetical protein